MLGYIIWLSIISLIIVISFIIRYRDGVKLKNFKDATEKKLDELSKNLNAIHEEDEKHFIDLKFSEIDDQISDLNERLNDLPSHFHSRKKN